MILSRQAATRDHGNGRFIASVPTADGSVGSFESCRFFSARSNVDGILCQIPGNRRSICSSLALPTCGARCYPLAPGDKIDSATRQTLSTAKPSIAEYPAHSSHSPIVGQLHAEVSSVCASPRRPLQDRKGLPHGFKSQRGSLIFIQACHITHQSANNKSWVIYRRRSVRWALELLRAKHTIAHLALSVDGN